MGRVCKRVKDTKANLKNERVKSNYTKYLGLVAVLGHEDGKGLVSGSFADAGEKGDDVMDFEESEDQAVIVRRRDGETRGLCCSPVRSLNVLPLRSELSKMPKTPCKLQSGKQIGSPKTPCGPGRLSSTPHVLANLLRTPKTPCTKSRFQSPPPALNNLVKTPKTPCSQESQGDSRLESLPVDILVKILCHLHHDQLKPAFHVSKRVREAVQLARQFHFNFTTPDRSRQALLNTMTPQPWEHWPFIKNRNSMLKPCPKTPKAPRHSLRPPPKFDPTEVCPIDDALFLESAFPSRCASSSSLSRSFSKSQLASNRVLFYNNDSNCCNSLL